MCNSPSVRGRHLLRLCPRPSFTAPLSEAVLYSASVRSRRRFPQRRWEQPLSEAVMAWPSELPAGSVTWPNLTPAIVCQFAPLVHRGPCKWDPSSVCCASWCSALKAVEWVPGCSSSPCGFSNLVCVWPAYFEMLIRVVAGGGSIEVICENVWKTGSHPKHWWNDTLIFAILYSSPLLSKKKFTLTFLTDDQPFLWSFRRRLNAGGAKPESNNR